MLSPEIKFTKEKILLSDGRYLLYYDFETEPEQEQSDCVTQSKDEENV